MKNTLSISALLRFLTFSFLLLELSGCVRHSESETRSPEERLRFVEFDAAQQVSQVATPVQLDKIALNKGLDQQFAGNKYGAPIPLQTPDYYVVTLGDWTFQGEEARTQGEFFKPGGDFWPNPQYRSLGKYRGDFPNVVLYQDSLKTLEALLPEGFRVNVLTVLSSSQIGLPGEHLVLEAKGEGGGRRLFYRALEGDSTLRLGGDELDLLDWSFHAGRKGLIALFRTDENRDGKWAADEPVISRPFILVPEQEGEE